MIPLSLARPVAAAVVLAATLGVPVASPQPPAGPVPAGLLVDCDPSPIDSELPWAQRLLQPRRVWPHSRGAGVTVAVIDSGVDTRHPQMDGRIAEQVDMIPPQPGVCTTHGTEVASIINAQAESGIGFHGLAPSATVLPIRVSDRGEDGFASTDPGVFAEAIRYAAEHADVINISMVMYEDDKRVRDAVAEAIAADVVVVAAVGNEHRDSGSDPTPYPAAYPGVLGVGAIAEDGTRLPQSQVGPYVDVVAPGADVHTAQPVAGHQRRSGTSYATAFVSATAALVKSRRPSLTAEEIVNRIIATATPSRGGPGYGAGVVNPYRAVTEERMFVNPQETLPPVAPWALDPAVAAEQARWNRMGERALLVTLVLLGLLVIVASSRSIVRRGRARGWRPPDEPTSP
jgi:type VII secretion-associated serine protease mycosin